MEGRKGGREERRTVEVIEDRKAGKLESRRAVKVKAKVKAKSQTHDIQVEVEAPKKADCNSLKYCNG